MKTIYEERYKMLAQNKQLTEALKAKKRRLNQRIESIGWALFLIWSGALLIAPETYVPEGAWLVGIGLIIIVSMGIRYLHGIKVEGFWTLLGFLALGLGIGEFFSLNLPVLPALLIMVGVVIVYKAFFGKISHKEDFWKYCWKSEDDKRA
jgi:hypothetical protein